MNQQKMNKIFAVNAIVFMTLVTLLIIMGVFSSAKAGQGIVLDPPAVTIGATTLTRAEATADLPFTADSIDQISPEQYRQIVESKAAMLLLADQAEKDGLDKQADTRRKLKMARLQILAEAEQARIAASVPDAAIRKDYDKAAAEYKPHDAVHIHRILVKTEKEAKAIIKALTKGADFAELAKGIDFAELAKEKSIDSSARMGGDIGLVTYNMLPKEFMDKVWNMKDGELTKKPFHIENRGWYIVKMEGRSKTGAPPYTDAEKTIRDVLARQKTDELVRDLAQRQKVQIFDVNGNPFKE